MVNSSSISSSISSSERESWTRRPTTLTWTYLSLTSSLIHDITYFELSIYTSFIYFEKRWWHVPSTPEMTKNAQAARMRGCLYYMAAGRQLAGMIGARTHRHTHTQLPYVNITFNLHTIDKDNLTSISPYICGDVRTIMEINRCTFNNTSFRYLIVNRIGNICWQ